MTVRSIKRNTKDPSLVHPPHSMYHPLVILVGLLPGIAALQEALGPTKYTVPGAFPTTAFAKYYNSPTATAQQVQPMVSDPVSHKLYPLKLTNPDHLPLSNTNKEHPLPAKAPSSKLLENALTQIESISKNPIFGENTCARCQASLEVAKFLALAAPERGPELAVRLCEKFKYSSTCGDTYSVLSFGSPATQVISLADVGGFDGQMICNTFFNLCPLPPTTPLNFTSWFSKPKPKPLPPPKKPSGKTLKVLHISDYHYDPRYKTGSEATCDNGLCCRSHALNSGSPNVTIFPAPRFGAYKCDTPLSLVMASLQAIPVLTKTEKTGFAWSMYTGDLVSHDAENRLSREYVMYAETVIFELLRNYLGTGPLYAALGNHDSYNNALDAPRSIGGPLSTQNYEHLAALWKHENWLPQAAVEQARKHYSAYAVQRKDGLRIITLNTDMWYKANYFNYINMTDPDVSGMLRFLVDELSAAEDVGERAWIIGHVLSGWDGSNPLVNPTDLFYQIVDRFTPHVIAGIFFGHSHEDQASIFYTNNATEISSKAARVVSWMGPSITPGGNMNSGFRVYEVDSSTFEIIDAHTWMSNVNTYEALDSQIERGPVYEYEYSTRETYGKAVEGWGASDPLNATWWHKVTEAMEVNNTLVEIFHKLQGRNSVKTNPCTGDCITAKICYIRSGSASIAKNKCKPGFGSVQ